MKRVLLSMIRFYRRRVSPSLPYACRFTPTCSEYAEEAIRRFGAARGGALAAKRSAAVAGESSGRYSSRIAFTSAGGSASGSS